MNLEKMNLVEMNSFDACAISAGGWIKKLGWAYLAQQIVDNWDEIKEGFQEGWQAGGNH